MAAVALRGTIFHDGPRRFAEYLLYAKLGEEKKASQPNMLILALTSFFAVLWLLEIGMTVNCVAWLRSHYSSECPDVSAVHRNVILGELHQKRQLAAAE